MAGVFNVPGIKCEECGEGNDDSTQGYNVVQKRHLCKACAQRLNPVILSDVSAGAIKWPCAKHAKKEVELYCRKCNAAMCHTCALTAHSGHDMDDILEFFEQKKAEIEKDVELNSMKQYETRQYQEMITKCTQDVKAHFSTLNDQVFEALNSKLKAAMKEKQAGIDKANKEADEAIRKIKKKNHAAIESVCSRYESTKNGLEKSRVTVLSELNEMKNIVNGKISDAAALADTCTAHLHRAESLLKSLLVDCDSKALDEKLANVERSRLAELPSLDKNLPLNIPKIAKRVCFDEIKSADEVGRVSGIKRSFVIKKTLNVSDIREPILIGIVDEKRVAIRDKSGSALHTVNIETGTVETLMHPNKDRGICDVAFLSGNRLAYSDSKSGTICMCSMDGKLERSLVLDHDESRDAYLCVDNRGKLLAANHVEGQGEIHILDPITGSHLHTITDIKPRSIMSIDTLQNGEIIVRSEETDIYWLYRSSGAIKKRLSLAHWSCRINCHVGADNNIYVSHRGKSGNDRRMHVCVISPDGEMLTENVITFPTLYRYSPRCVVPTKGSVVVLNLNELFVYKEALGIDDITETDVDG